MIENGYGICFNDWLFDKEIKNELRLLIAISSLSAKLGYCTASNEYLSGLFGIDVFMISKKIKKLENRGHIKCEYKKRGAEILSRKIYVLRLSKMTTDDCQKRQPTIVKNDKENNISSNNKKVSINDTLISVGHTHTNKRFIEPNLEEVKAEFHKHGLTDERIVNVFFAHYESNGWMVGKNKMKNWRMAVSKWAHNESLNGKAKKSEKQGRDDYLAMLGDVDDLF